MDVASSTKQILAPNTPGFTIPFWGSLSAANPVNMPDLIRKRSGYGQLRPACSQNQAGYYVLDPTSCIHSNSHFSKGGIDHSVQNQPGSNLDGLVRVWPNASGLEASWCAGIIRPFSGRMQLACYQT